MKNMPEKYADVLENPFAGVLPVGFVDSEGEFHREVHFRPTGIIGSDEHAMGDPKLKNNPSKIMTALFSNGLVQKIGSIDLIEVGSNVATDIMRKLSIADRDYLLMKASEITFGDEIKFDFTCQREGCGEENEVKTSISKIPVKYIPDESPRDDNGFVTGEYTLEIGALDEDNKLHKEVVYRLPNGLDSEKLAPVARRNMPEANTALMHMIISRIGEISHITPSLIAERLNSRDRQGFVEHIGESKAGPDFSVEFECAGCGHLIKTEIPTTAFLSR